MVIALALLAAAAFGAGDQYLGSGHVWGIGFGWFGQQWRTRRAIAGALVTAAALCLEPLARRVTIDPIQHRDVSLAEVAAGLALAAAVLFGRYFRHSQA